MNIWLVQTGEPLPLKKNVRKMRTAILADKLLERGHKVIWWASAYEHQQKVMIADGDRDFDISKEYRIRILRGCGYRKNVSISRYIDHLMLALKFRRQSTKYPKPDVMVASTPDHLLAYEAARYANKNGITLLIDIRDLWPDTFLMRFRRVWFLRLAKILLTLDCRKLGLLLKNADSLVAVSRGYLRWGLNKIGKSETSFDRVFYLGYKAGVSGSLSDTEGSSVGPSWLKGRENQKIFVFIGTFGISYELELVLEAARYFHDSGRADVSFVLAGTGEKFHSIRESAADLPNVVLPGWIGEREINSLLRSGYAGLVPCRSVENTMPNKPFEYLSAGLPLINSLEGEMRELIDQHCLGLNYLPGDLSGLCRCIECLASDSSMYNKMLRNASRFFKKYGDADKIYSEYATHVEEVFEQCGKNRKPVLLS